MDNHKTEKESHVFEHNQIIGHEIDFENVEIIDRADSVKKLELKEMLYIRKLKPTLNKQKESELFTLIIKNVKLETSITRDIQIYLKPKSKQISRP
jgi:hypothetical protein